VEAQLSQTLVVQVSQTATRILRTRHACNRRTQLLGQELVFKPTPDTEFAAGMLPQYIASDEEQFRQVVDWLYKYIYESSGALARITPLFGGLVPGVTMAIKFLRNYYEHDLEHGSPGEIRKKYQRVSEVFLELVGVPILTTPAQWQRAQLALLRQVAQLMDDVADALVPLDGR